MRVRQDSEADHVAFRAEVEAMMALMAEHGLDVEWIRGKSRWLVTHWGLKTTMILVTQTPGSDDEGNFIDTSFLSGDRVSGTPLEAGRDALRVLGIEEGEMFAVCCDHPDKAKEQRKAANVVIAGWKAPKKRKPMHQWKFRNPGLYAGTPEFEAYHAIPRLNRGQRP